MSLQNLISVSVGEGERLSFFTFVLYSALFRICLAFGVDETRVNVFDVTQVELN